MSLQEFLSRYKISARVLCGYAVLGVLLVVAGVVGYFSFNNIHGGYAQATVKIDAVRRLAVLQNDLSRVNAALLRYMNQNREDDVRAVTDAFDNIEENLNDFLTRLNGAEASETAKRFETAVKELQTQATELFSLAEKSYSLSDKARRQGEAAAKRLTAMINDSTLPSATLALSNLQDQLDRLIDVALKNSDHSAQYTASVKAETEALRKALTAVRGAEMVNLKQLKGVTAAADALETELNRKIKTIADIGKAKTKILGDLSQTDKLIKELTETLSVEASSTLYRAESQKLLWQKTFVAYIAFSGVLTLIVCVLSLWGVRYPLNRLIEDVWEFARGEPKNSIPFTERKDEIGALAQSLSALLEAWKNPLVFSSSAKNYLPLGTASGETGGEEDSDGFVVLGDEGADAETQLRQILLFFQHLQASATEMSSRAATRFDGFCTKLDDVTRMLRDLENAIRAFAPVLTQSRESAPFAALLKKLGDAYEKSSDFMMRYAKAQEKTCENMVFLIERMQDFSAGLLQWVRAASEISSVVHKTSLQTKILALNASIEALKLGDKAQACNDIISDIRRLSQQTSQSVAHLQDNMGNLQEESNAFAGVLENINGEVAALRAALPQFNQVCVEQHQDSFELSEKASATASGIQETFDSLLPLMAKSAELVKSMDAALPQILNEATQTQSVWSEFIEELPKFEG